ncbi:hypothetical protein GGU11DRAFT_760007 [Lentinula aff. detonsa]|nr:hypothetical protein GGU11DRAFT_760007 [Lentinula aff. detonsa]
MSTPSAKDEAQYQIFDLLNLLIKVKVLNTVSQTPNISTSTGSIRQFFCDSKGNAIPLNNTGTSIFTPCWARSASAHLRPIYGAGRNSGPNPGLADQLGCAEIKSHWSYSTRSLMKIYHGGPEILDQQRENAQGVIEKSLQQKNSLHGKKSVTRGLEGILPHNGSVDPSDTGTYADEDEIEVEISDAEVAAIDSDTDDTMNVKSNDPGHSCATRLQSKKQVQIVVPTQTPSSDTKPGLILSALMRFEDPKLLKCLQAFTYLALHRKKWQENGTSLVDILAPLDEISLIMCP